MAKWRSSSVGGALKLGRSVITGNLTHRYGFEDMTADDEVGTAHGTITGAVFVSSDVSYLALRFDGIDDVLTIPSFDPGSAWTFMCWIRGVNGNAISEATPYKRLWSKQSNEIQLRSNLWWYKAGGGHQIGANFPMGRGGMFHLAITWDGSAMNTYYNGRLAFNSIAAPDAWGTQAWKFAYSYVSANYTPMELDEVLFYNSALSGSDIALCALLVD